MVSVNRIVIYIGSYVNIIEAARKYDESALKYIGKRAILNFPEEHKNDNSLESKSTKI
jgi:5-formaminoimidazole-4-carboxamide-1-beta-D-ribofuranosyl 5'-monophosphate synthetase